MSGAPSTRPTSAYVAIGATMTNFVVDVATGDLTPGETLTLPARVQFAWPHATLPVLYVGCADRGSDSPVKPFYLCALRRDEAGNLSLHGDPVALPARPIHLTTDVPSGHVLTAYAAEPGLSVHETRADGTIGAEVPRAEPFDFGSNPHSIRVEPGNARAILVARGKKGFGKPTYVEGGFKLLLFDGGQVENVETVKPSVEDAPRGFNPRNIDFHPSRPLLFATLEAQNELAVFAMNGSDIDPKPLFTQTILERPDDVRKRQDGGEVIVHPNGRFAYVANRNDGYVEGHAGPSWLLPDPLPVFPGGENSIAVFSIDAETGEPTLVQHEDSRGLHPRTMALDPSGRILIAANVAPTLIRDGDALTEIPANLAIFTIGEDGRLTFRRRHDIDTGSEKLFWVGIVD